MTESDGALAAGTEDMAFKMTDAPRGSVNVTIPARSIQSYRWLL
jgi:hypothetical protein